MAIPSHSTLSTLGIGDDYNRFGVSDNTSSIRVAVNLAEIESNYCKRRDGDFKKYVEESCRRVKNAFDKSLSLYSKND